MQKRIAFSRMVLAVLSTLGIGVLSAIVNVQYSSVLGGLFLRYFLCCAETGMLISLVVVAFVHGIA